MKRLHVFDMDGTLLRGAASVELSRHLGRFAEADRIEQEWVRGEIGSVTFWERMLPLWRDVSEDRIDAAFRSSDWLAGVPEVFADIRGRGEMILDPDEFYILASKEAVTVPPDYAAEMMPFDPLVGEFRAHSAGFFDPGFGYAAAGGRGARAVLEVRSREVPFILEHGQTVARLVYERMTERPRSLYGEVGSNYQAQGLKLSKHFR